MECINIAVETSFFAPLGRKIQLLLPHINTAYVDLKIFSSGLHKQYCGINNQVILDNLLRTNQLEKCPRLVVRTPNIPGLTMISRNWRTLARFCAQLNWLDHVELLPYHKLGTATYERDWPPLPAWGGTYPHAGADGGLPECGPAACEDRTVSAARR